MVDVVTDTFQIRAYGFFVSESLVFVVIHVVGYFAGFGHFAYLYLDGGYALGNFAYKLFPVGTEDFVFFGREGLAQATEIFQQTVLVDNGSRYDVVDGKITQYTAFYLYLHGVFLQFYFQAAGKLRFVEDTFADEYGTGLVIHVVHQGFGNVADVGQPTAGGFLLPLFGVAVTLKADRLGGDDGLFHNAEDGFILADSFFHQFVDGDFEFVQLVCHSCIDGNHGGGTVGGRTCGTELKAVAGKGEWRSTVTVGGIQ